MTSPYPSETIAFVCAMPMERTPLTEKLALTEAVVGGMPMQTGTLNGRPVVAIVTGMGLDYARDGVERLLDATPVAHVMVVGITGALESETPIGTLVMPEVVVNGKTGSEHRPTHISTVTPQGKMWTVAEFTTQSADLEKMRAAGVISVDMETAVIAVCCEARNIPWSVFRSISDRANDGSVDNELFQLSNMDGTPNHENIKAYIEKYPERLPQMAKMGEEAKLATETAADAAIEACSRL